MLAALYASVVPTHRDRSNGLADDLRRLGELVAEGSRADQPHVDHELSA